MEKQKHVPIQTPKTKNELDAWIKLLCVRTGRFKFDSKNIAFLVRIQFLIIRKKDDGLFWKNIEEVWNEYQQSKYW